MRLHHTHHIQYTNPIALIPSRWSKIQQVAGNHGFTQTLVGAATTAAAARGVARAQRQKRRATRLAQPASTVAVEIHAEKKQKN